MSRKVPPVPSSILVLVLCALLPALAAGPGEETPAPSPDVRCALGRPAADGTRWLAVAALDPEGYRDPGVDGAVTVEVTGGALVDGLVRRGLLLAGRGTASARVRLAAGAAELLLANAGGDDVAARVVRDGTPGPWVSPEPLPDGVEPPPPPARPVRLPPLRPEDVPDDPLGPFVRARWEAPPAPGEPVILHVRALDEEGDVVDTLDDTELWLSLSGAEATFTGSCPRGALVDGAGEAWAVARLEKGELDLEVLPAAEGELSVLVQWRRAGDMRSTGDRVPVAPASEPSSPGEPEAATERTLPDRGTRPAWHAPWHLPYRVTDAVLDPGKPRLWIASREDRAVYLVNLRTGKTVRQWLFDHGPESLAISPDGTRLFAAVPTCGVDSALSAPCEDGHVASWDLAGKVLDRWMEVPGQPFDLVATANGHLVYSVADRDWVTLRAVDATDGTSTGWGAPPRPRVRLALHPSGNRVYTASRSWPHGLVLRYEVTSEGELKRAASASLDGLATEVGAWATPDGDALVLGSGDVFELAEDPASDLVAAEAMTDGSVADTGFDAANHVLATAEDRAVRYYNLSTRIFFREEPLEGPVRFAGFAEGKVFALVEEEEDGNVVTHLVSLPHPAPDGADNRSPMARLAVRPAEPTTRDTVTLDASGSTDPDASGELRFRWDFEGDGTWDTPFSPEPAATHVYAFSGWNHPRVQVADALGAADVAEQALFVEQYPEPGEPGPEHEPFVLPYWIQSGDQIAFDPARGMFWIAQDLHPRKLVYAVDARRGIVIRQWEVPDAVTRLRLVPRTHRLYAVLEVDDWDRSSPVLGYIASWDLDRMVLDRLLRVDYRPRDVIETAGGHLVVGTRSGPLRTLDPRDGHVIDTTDEEFYRPILTPHPSGRWFYVRGSGSEWTRHVDVTPDGRFIPRWSVETTSPPSSRWIVPPGDRLLSRDGTFLSTAEDAEHDLLPVGHLEIQRVRDVTFDPEAGVLAALEREDVHYLRLDDGSLFSSIDWLDPVAIGFLPDRLAVVTRTRTGNHLELLTHPAPGGRWDTAPGAAFVVNPARPTNLDEVTLDASGTTDAESPLEELRFRWDLDGDGTWDIDWSADPRVTVPRVEPGPRTFRLEVRDPCGLRDTTEHHVEVEFRPDPGEPAPPHDPGLLPFYPTHARFVPGTPYVFVTDKHDHAVYQVDTRTGLSVRRWRFEFPPGMLRVSPDGHRLHARLAACSSRDRDPSCVDRLVSWNLDTMTLDRYLRAPVSLLDFVVTPDGFYVVSSLRQFSLLALDPEDGHEVARAEAGNRGMTLALAPDGVRIYAADPWDVGLKLDVYEVGPGGGIRLVDRFLYPLSRAPGTRVWLSPDGKYMLSRNGRVYSVPGDPHVQPGYLDQVTKRVSDVAFDVRNDEFFVAARGILRYDAATLHREWVYGLPTEFDFVGKVGKMLHGLYRWYPGEGTRLVSWEVNHPPVAEAGEDQVLECTGDLAATATLDGSGSWDPDSPGDDPHQDLAAWDWFEGENHLASGVTADVPFSLGEHDVTLTVTDRSDATDDDTVHVSVRDTIPPAGAITWPPAGACLGPADVPVVLADDVTDSCDPAPAREWTPGPSIDTHGDHQVSLTVTDRAGNALEDRVSFTIDLVPPAIVVHSPAPGWALGPGSIPASLAFTATDDDGATGGVVHEWIDVEGCVAWDGASWGDGDGLLSDEEIPLGPAELCRVVRECGFAAGLHDPVVTIHATDCGGNEATASRRIPGSFVPLPGLCPP